jgi:hypothetical protein
LARLDRKFDAASELPLDLRDLLEAMTPEAGTVEECWKDAITRYLSGFEGWREALVQLDGTFTSDGSPTGDRKER